MQINSSQLALLKLHASLFLNFQSKNFSAIEIFHYLIGKEYEITLQFGSISSKVNEIFTKYPKNTQQLSYLDLLNNFNNSNSFSCLFRSPFPPCHFFLSGKLLYLSPSIFLFFICYNINRRGCIQ